MNWVGEKIEGVGVRDKRYAHEKGISGLFDSYCLVETVHVY